MALVAPGWSDQVECPRLTRTSPILKSTVLCGRKTFNPRKMEIVFLGLCWFL